MPSKRTHEEFYDIVEKLGNNEYELLSIYEKCNVKVTLKHIKCGNIYEVYPRDFMRLEGGRRCPRCSGKQVKTHETFKEEIYNLPKGNEYTILSEYVNNKTRVLFKHNVCGLEFSMTPVNFYRENRCPKCSKRYRKTTEYLNNEIDLLTKGEYKLLSDYKNSRTEVTLLHLSCNNIFKVIPYKFLVEKVRCPKCSPRSKAEEIIDTVLSNYNLKFNREVILPGCKYKNNLKFDFQVYLNDSKFIMIEYNGKQHYEEVKFNGNTTKHDLKTTQIRDSIKKEYCSRYGIPLIIIPYTEFNTIESSLYRILSDYNVI
jgi:DNA-directed RNA polymerase subunit RPC12/RpoP